MTDWGIVVRELAELKNAREPYELEFKSPSELVDLLEDRGLTIDGERGEAAYLIEAVGYFHLKGYLAVLKEAVRRKDYRSGTKFSDAIALLQWEQRLSALLLEQIGKVEMRLRSAVVECIGTGRGDGYLEEANYDVNRLKNQHARKLDHRSRVQLSEWDWFVDWLEKRIYAVMREKEFEFIQGHANKRKNQHLPLWILLETMSLGDLLIIYEHLSPKNRAAVAAKFANASAAGGQLKENEFGRMLEAIRTLRNMASHYHAFFDKQFPFPPLSEFRDKFRESPYFPSLGASRKKCTTYDVILMLAFLEPAVQRDTAFSADVADILRDFPASIQGLSEQAFGGRKGWQRHAPWSSGSQSPAGENVDYGNRERQKRPKSAKSKGKRRR